MPISQLKRSYGAPAGFITPTLVAALPHNGGESYGQAGKKDQFVANSLIGELKDHSRSTGSSIWRDTASGLESSRKNWAEPNLSHISRHSQEKETVLIPGKVLGSGEINGKQTVAAFSFSDGAKNKIAASGGRTLSIRELMEENPKGKGVRILV